MPVRIIKKPINTLVGLPVKDTVVYPFISQKSVTKNMNGTDYLPNLVGQLFFRNIDNLNGDICFQYSVFDQTMNIITGVKLIWDGIGYNPPKPLILDTTITINQSDIDSLGVRSKTISINRIDNNSKNNLVGLFIYAYNNVSLPANTNIIDIAYFKKVE